MTPEIKQSRPVEMMTLQQDCRVRLLLGERESFGCEVMRRSQITIKQAIDPKPEKHREPLLRLCALRAQLSRAAINARDVWRGKALYDQERRAQRYQELQLQPVALRRFGKLRHEG